MTSSKLPPGQYTMTVDAVRWSVTTAGQPAVQVAFKPVVTLTKAPITPSWTMQLYGQPILYSPDKKDVLPGVNYDQLLMLRFDGHYKLLHVNKGIATDRCMSFAEVDRLARQISQLKIRDNISLIRLWHLLLHIIRNGTMVADLARPDGFQALQAINAALPNTLRVDPNTWLTASYTWVLLFTKILIQIERWADRTRYAEHRRGISYRRRDMRKLRRIARRVDRNLRTLCDA